MPTGAKLYARDFGTADMHGWPDETDHAMSLLASDATHRLVGTDLMMLAPDLQPDRVVTAEDLEAARIRARATSWKILLPEGPNADLSGPAGRVAYLPRFGKVRDRTANPGAKGAVVFGEQTGQ